MIKKIFLNTKLIYFILISLFILFGRSFSGISILSYRIGEWITALSLLISIIFLFVGYKRYDQYLIGRQVNIIHKLIIFSFFLELALNFPINKSTYIFKASSYIWIIIYLYLGNFVFSKINYEYNFFNCFFVFLPIIFIFQTTFYPEFIKTFFDDFSDKFEFLKAGDVLLIFVLTLLVLQNTLNNSLKYKTIFNYIFINTSEFN